MLRHTTRNEIDHQFYCNRKKSFTKIFVISKDISIVTYFYNNAYKIYYLYFITY